MSAPAPADDDPPSALPLRCAGAPAPSISTTRHDDEGTDGGGSSRTSPSSTLCLRKAWTEAYDGVVPLQDGSGRLLCWRRNGQIWLATVDVVDPTGGSVLRVGDKPARSPPRGAGAGDGDLLVSLSIPAAAGCSSPTTRHRTAANSSSSMNWRRHHGAGTRSATQLSTIVHTYILFSVFVILSPSQKNKKMLLLTFIDDSGSSANSSSVQTLTWTAGC